MLKVLGGEQEGEFKAVASGTLPNGKPVVVNSDGTVSVVSETSISEGVGSNVTFESAGTTFIGSAYDATAQKVVIAYQDGGNSSYGTAVVGTVSGTGITFGTPVVFSTSSFGTNNISVAYDSGAGKTIICCNESESFEDGVVYVGTVSGTSISFGSRQVFSSVAGNPVKADIAYDSTNNKIVIAYEESGNVFKSIVGTVSGSSVTFGSATTIVSSTIAEPRVLHDTVNNKIVVLYKGTSDYGYAVVGTVSGTSITFGSIVTFNSAQTLRISGAYDSSNGKVVVSYKDGGNSSYGESAVGTVSGTSISFGTPVVFESAVVDWISSAYNAAAGKVIIAYQDKGNADTGTYVEATVSGTSISFDTPTTFPSTADAIYTSVAYDSDQYASIISFMNIDNASYGTSFSYQSAGAVSNLTAENYIGMSSGVIDATAGDPEAGTEVVFESAEVTQISSTYDPSNNKVVIVYNDYINTDYGTAIVGTVSDDTITFGTPVVFATTPVSYTTATFDSSNNKVVISYRQNSTGIAYGIVGTVSGDSISFGSATSYHSGAFPFSSAFNTSANKVVIVYQGNSGYGESVVGTVSGTSISFGTPVVFESAVVASAVAVYATDTSKIAIGYADNGNSGYGTAIAGTVSGTSISYGTPVAFSTTSSTTRFAGAFDSTNNKVVLSYSVGGSTGRCIVCTVFANGTMSFGTEVTYVSSQVDYYNSMVFDSTNNKIAISSSVAPSRNAVLYVGTVSGTSISFASPLNLTGSSRSDYITSAFDSSNGSVVVSYADSPSSARGTSIVADTISVARYPVADGNPASIDIIGSVSTNQLSLTAGEKYYVQNDGTLSTTAGSPSVLAGTAIASNKLIVKT